MTCLLYGVVVAESRRCGRDAARRVLPPGVGGAVVRLVEEGGVAAAVSAVDAADLTPTVTRLLAFARVIEALHTQRTVMPMRYGCVLDDEGQLVDLLRHRGTEYAAIVHRLDGCVEMGVRVLLPAEASASRAPVESATRPVSGRDYLTERAARSTREDHFAGALAAARGRVLGALAGRAERTETDGTGTANACFASLSFLIKREAVPSFRREFRRLEETEPARLLLTGPWPPYSFVVPERNGRGDG